MEISQKGIDLIKSFEGLVLSAYKCPAGVWTIGYGTTLGVSEGDKCTQSEAEEMLVSDLRQFQYQIEGCLSNVDELTQNQYDALVSFVYNVGIGNFKSSTLKKRVEANPNDPDIAYQFSRWNKADGKVLSGLTRRRKAEADLYFQ